MASINNVINVAILKEGKLAGRANMNTICIITDEQEVLSSSERFRSYKDIASVEADFGVTSKAYQFASVVFATSPNAINFGGNLIIGYHRAKNEAYPATSANLTSAKHTSELIGVLQGITDGQFKVEINEVEQSVNGLNLGSISDLADVATILRSSLTDVEVEFVNDRFVITTDGIGATAKIGYFKEIGDDQGTELAEVLGLAQGTGAVAVNGGDVGTHSPETKLEALSAIKAEVNFKGAMFINDVADGDVAGISSWSSANDVIFYDVFSGAKYLEKNATTNPVWANTLAGGTNYRCLLSKSDNRKLASSYMARTHSVNFNAENSAMTMHLKELAVVAEEYSQTEINKAKEVGLDIYTTIKDLGVVLTSGANDFVDNVYNVIAYKDALQIDTFNLLKATSTKIMQTEVGRKQLVDCVEKTTRSFVRAGVFGAGDWSSPDSFGDIDTFKKNIKLNGFYWIIGEFADQAQSDRQQRKAPVLQGAVKMAGAIHSADIIVNLNY